VSRLFETYIEKVNPSGVNPLTICQFVVPSNHRVVLSSIELQPLGSTGATSPIEFDLSLQDDAGTSSDDSANLIVNSPGADETKQLQVRNAFSGEPTTSTPRYSFSLHQQATRVWNPPNPMGEHVMEGGTRWGLRVLSACSFNIGVSVQLEE